MEPHSVTKELSLTVGQSDPNPTNNDTITHTSSEDNLILSQLLKLSSSQPPIPEAPSSSSRRKSMSTRYEDYHLDMQINTPTSSKNKKNKQSDSLSSTMEQNGVKKPRKSIPLSCSIPPAEYLITHQGNANEEGGSESLACSSSTTRNFPFHEVKSFEDFRILVNGLIIDGELPNDVRMGYYKLCIHKKQYLHDGLQDGLYEKFVVGMIGEIVRIANQIKTCKLTTKREDFERWDNSLKSMELLGMNVGFLRDKINALVTFVFESEGASDVKRYAKAKSEHQCVKDELSSVAAKLRELEESATRLEGISYILEQKVKKYEQKLKEDVDALW